MAIDVWTTPYYASWAEETTPGTEQSPANWLGLVQAFNPTFKNTIQRHRHAGSADFYAWTPGKKEVRFGLRFKVNEGRFMLMCFGSESVVGSDPYTHTLSVGRPLPSFTMELAVIHATENFVLRFIGCKVSRLTLKYSVNGVLEAECEIVALTVDKYTSKTSISDNTAKPYSFEQATLTLNAVSVANLRDFVFTLDNKVETIGHCGAREPNCSKEGGAQADVTLELTANADTWWDAWDAASPTEMDADANFVRTAAQDAFKIKWYDFPIDELTLTPPEEGEFTERLTLPAKYAELEIIDSVATY